MAEKTGAKKVDFITSIILIVSSLLIIVEAFSMDIMDKYSPGPGLFPLMIAIAILMLSVGILLESRNPKTPDKASKFNNKEGILTTGKMFLGLIVYAFFIGTFGYVIMTFLLVLYIMIVIEKINLKVSLITSVVITLMMFLIFQVGLKVQLPQGILG